MQTATPQCLFQLTTEDRSTQKLHFLNWRSDRRAFFLRDEAGTVKVMEPIPPQLLDDWYFPDPPFPECPAVFVRPYRLVPPPIRASADGDPAKGPADFVRSSMERFTIPERWEHLYGSFLYPGDEATIRKQLERLNRGRKECGAEPLKPEDFLADVDGCLTAWLHARWAKAAGVDLKKIGYAHDGVNGAHWRSEAMRCLAWMKKHCVNGLVRVRDIGTSNMRECPGFVLRDWSEEAALLATVRFVIGFTNGESVYLRGLLRHEPRADEVREIEAMSSTRPPVAPWHSEDYRTVFLRHEGKEESVSLSPLQGRIIQTLDEADGKTLADAAIIHRAWCDEPPTNARPWDNFRNDPAKKLRGLLLHRFRGGLRLTPPC